MIVSYKKKKVLVIGSGVMGLRFAGILSDHHCDVSFYRHSKSQVLPSEYEKTASLDNMQLFDACFICSPTSTHKYYLGKCIDAGVHVFVEKPIADSLSGLDVLLKKRGSHQVIMVGFNLRTLPAIKKLKTLLPKLGKIYYAHFDIGQYLPFWRPKKNYTQFYSAHYDKGGGVALDLVHELDLALSLFPQMKLQSVESEKLSSLNISVEDYVEFHFDDPAVRITLDYLSHVKTRRYHIVGERGTITCDVGNERLELSLVGGEHSVLATPVLFDREASFVCEVENFLSSVKKNRATRYNERDLGIDALQYALAARKKYV